MDSSYRLRRLKIQILFRPEDVCFGPIVGMQIRFGYFRRLIFYWCVRWFEISNIWNSSWPRCASRLRHFRLLEAFSHSSCKQFLDRTSAKRRRCKQMFSSGIFVYASLSHSSDLVDFDDRFLAHNGGIVPLLLVLLKQVPYSDADLSTYLTYRFNARTF